MDEQNGKFYKEKFYETILDSLKELHDKHDAQARDIVNIKSDISGMKGWAAGFGACAAAGVLLIESALKKIFGIQ